MGEEKASLGNGSVIITKSAQTVRKRCALWEYAVHDVNGYEFDLSFWGKILKLGREDKRGPDSWFPFLKSEFDLSFWWRILELGLSEIAGQMLWEIFGSFPMKSSAQSRSISLPATLLASPALAGIPIFHFYLSILFSDSFCTSLDFDSGLLVACCIMFLRHLRFIFHLWFNGLAPLRFLSNY